VKPGTWGDLALHAARTTSVVIPPTSKLRSDGNTYNDMIVWNCYIIVVVETQKVR